MHSLLSKTIPTRMCEADVFLCVQTGGGISTALSTEQVLIFAIQ